MEAIRDDGEGEEVYVTDLQGENATILVRKWVSGEREGRTGSGERSADRACRPVGAETPE